MSHGRLSHSIGRIGAAAAIALGAIGFATAVSLSAGSAAASAQVPTIYVANHGGTSVGAYALPSTGNVAPTSATLGGLSSPFAQAFDGSGDLWVTDGGGEIVAYTPAQLALGGSPTPAITLTNNGHSIDVPLGLAFDKKGDLWVYNTNSSGPTSALVMFTPAELASSGSPAAATTIVGSANELYLNGAGQIAFDAAGDLWAGSNNAELVQELTPSQLAVSGTVPTPAVVITGSSLTGDPGAVVFDNAGDLWVGNYDGGSIVEFTPAQLASTGSPTAAVTLTDDGSGTSIDEALGLAFDSTGTLWASSRLANSVVGYAPSQLSSTGHPAPTDKLIGGATALDQPSSLALADPPQVPTHVAATVAGNTASVTWQAPNLTGQCHGL